ncbi:hypothetical protein [Lacimicrobium sp. SS2-24]|nr:hypothetical protein [Lacimicrobium sp. SS2-24]
MTPLQSKVHLNRRGCIDADSHQSGEQRESILDTSIVGIKKSE